jgi:hypothetical protein
MANTKLQFKRTTVSGRLPNTTNSANSSYIDAGEFAVNLTDGKVVSSNGTVTFEIGANLSSLNLTGALTANGSNGTSGYVLASNSTGIYWAPPSSAVASINYAQNNVLTTQWANTADTFPKTLATIQLTTAGNPVQIFAMGDANPLSTGAWGKLALYRDSTMLTGNIHFESSLANENNPYCLQFIDTVGAGAYTYTLKCTQVSGGNVQFGESNGPVIGVVELQNVVGTINTTAQYTFTNTHTHSATVTMSNNQRLQFAPTSGSANVYLTQQSDDNFVFYTTNTSGGSRAVFNIYANTLTSTQTGALRLNTPLDMSIYGIYANNSLGTSGQVLTSNSSGVYWSTASGGGATLTANSTDTQTFYLPMANTTSGSWSNGVVSTTKLYFVPSTGTLNATIFNSLSDESVKENIESIPSALDVVRNLDGVSFNWKDNGLKSYGVIAQEVEKIIPELVSDTDPKSVNYSGIIAFLINAVKELDAQVRNTSCSCNCNK